MDKQVAELIGVLDTMLPILEWDRSRWYDWAVQCKAQLESGDPDGLRQLLSAYRGLGSFNNLEVGQSISPDGKFYWRFGHQEKNTLLEDLRQRALLLAIRLKQQV